MTTCSQISFHSISYSVKLKKATKPILHDISGVFGTPEKGEMVCNACSRSRHSAAA